MEQKFCGSCFSFFTHHCKLNISEDLTWHFDTLRKFMCIFFLYTDLKIISCALDVIITVSHFQ